MSEFLDAFSFSSNLHFIVISSVKFYASTKTTQDRDHIMRLQRV